MKHEKRNPFHPGVTSRLHRMGLLNHAGHPNLQLLTIQGALHAAMLFDDLLDAGQSMKVIRQIIQTYDTLLAAGERRKFFVLYSWHYDSLELTFPPVAWRISGRDDLIELFMKGFIPELHKHCDALGQEGGDA